MTFELIDIFLKICVILLAIIDVLTFGLIIGFNKGEHRI